MLGLNSFPTSLNAVRLALIVDEEGIPVRAKLRVDGGGVDADGTSRFVRKATYEFTKWDGDLTISVPE